MRPRLWLVIFVLLQLADGVLTYAAVERFGAAAEGNPILATWIMITGALPALVGSRQTSIWAKSRPPNGVWSRL